MKGRDDRTNHSNQMNPNNDAYWQARGYNERPDDWENQLANGADHQAQHRRQDVFKPRK